MTEKYSSGSANLLTGDGGGGPVGAVNQMLDVSMSAEGLFQVCILVIVLYVCMYTSFNLYTYVYAYVCVVPRSAVYLVYA